MNTQRGFRYFIFGLFLCTGLACTALAVEESLPESEVLMKALVDEIDRSMDLRMEDLEKPYFIQYTVGDTLVYQLSARYGALTASDRERSRDLHSYVRVGSYELDNTNFTGESGGFFPFSRGARGGRTSLPLDDDYKAIRQAVWWVTDWEYKDAVETLTKKRAYMRDKNLQDRAPDYSMAPVVDYMEPTAKLVFDKGAWEENLKKISAHFKKYPQVQDSQVRLIAGAGNTYVINSEGTRVRTADNVTLLTVSAEVQAEDGMEVSDSILYCTESPQELPALERVLEEIDKMVNNLIGVMNAPVLESYTGPVLFDGVASPQLFREMLSEGVAGAAEPVGTQRALFEGPGSLEKKLDQRLLPESFRVFDDPTLKKVGDSPLLGHYRFDDEGVKAERVELVSEGVIKNMVMSRTPTKKFSSTNGHGRRALRGGEIRAAIGSLFIEDEKGVSSQELKEALIEEAKDQNLEYGLRISKVRSASVASSQSDLLSFILGMQRSGGRQKLGDPVQIYKVYVSDGREEMVRGCEFSEVKLRDLRDIAAAGKTATVYNYIGIGMGGATPATSVIAPPVLFEDLELAKIVQEYPKRPLLKAPLFR